MHKESFSQIRQMMNKVAVETDSTLRINRISRALAITFELVPDGGSYGPMLRVNDAMLNDPVYMNDLLQVGAARMHNELKILRDKMNVEDK